MFRSRLAEQNIRLTRIDNTTKSESNCGKNGMPLRFDRKMFGNFPLYLAIASFLAVLFHIDALLPV